MNADSFGDCPICLASLFFLDLGDEGVEEASCSPVVALRCGHVFHATCIAQASNASRKCPCCRAPLEHAADQAEGGEAPPPPQEEVVGCRGAVKVRPVVAPAAAAPRSSPRQRTIGSFYLSQASPTVAGRLSSQHWEGRLDQNDTFQPGLPGNAKAAAYLRSLEATHAEFEARVPELEGLKAARERLATLKAQRKELEEIARISDALSRGDVSRETDRDVLARCATAVRQLHESRREALKVQVGKVDRLKRKKDALIDRVMRLQEADCVAPPIPGSSAVANAFRNNLGVPFVADDVETSSTSPLVGSSIRPLEIRAPPPPDDWTGHWDSNSTTAASSGPAAARTRAWVQGGGFDG
jgi:hypothetical protein